MNGYFNTMTHGDLKLELMTIGIQELHIFTFLHLIVCLKMTKQGMLGEKFGFFISSFDENVLPSGFHNH